jgi:hypothetical protein
MELWQELHERALTHQGDDIPYLLQFSLRIPKFNATCRCKEDWMRIVRQNPPKFGENGEYFAWTVLCHNLVNQKLGKPTYTVDEAKAFYTKV